MGRGRGQTALDSTKALPQRVTALGSIWKLSEKPHSQSLTGFDSPLWEEPYPQGICQPPSASAIRRPSYPLVSPPAAKKRLTSVYNSPAYTAHMDDLPAPEAEPRPGRGRVPSGGSRGQPTPQPFPASRGRVAHGPSPPLSEAATLHLSDQPSISHPPWTLSLPLPLVRALVFLGPLSKHPA